jgi:hypothetical protein
MPDLGRRAGVASRRRDRPSITQTMRASAGSASRDPVAAPRFASKRAGLRVEARRQRRAAWSTVDAKC